jgi:DNA-binding CsgD family transcriptional regulator
MLLHDFLIEMAHNHELSLSQEQILILRLAEEKDYEEIAAQLRTSPGACLKQMGHIYKKFGVSGSYRGKENRLRISLLDQFGEWSKVKAAADLQPQRLKNPPNFGRFNEETELIGFISHYPDSKLSWDRQHGLKLTDLSSSKLRSLVMTTPHQNLPSPQHSHFIGRETEITRLLELLSSDRAAHIITVNGLAGVGKTALVLEAAYRCLQASRIPEAYLSAPNFEAIIFTSAKENYLTSAGILPRLQRDHSLSDICRAITTTLDRPDLVNMELSQQLNNIREYLSKKRTLLILDNLESVDDQTSVLAFLYDLPPTVKVVITSREQALFVPLHLESLLEIDSLRIIKNKGEEQGIKFNLEQCQILYQETSGIPAAAIYAVNKLSAGYSLLEAIEHIKDGSSDLANFLFTSSVKRLIGQPSYSLLMAAARFEEPPTRNAIALTADINNDSNVADGLAKLQQLSLLKQQGDRYSMLELIRNYAISDSFIIQ